MTDADRIARNRYFLMTGVNLVAVGGAVLGLLIAGRSQDNLTSILGGALILAFELPPSAPTMQRIVRIGGTLADDALIKCVTARLASIPLATVATASRGTLSYRFSAQERTLPGRSRGDTAASGAVHRALAEEDAPAVSPRAPRAVLRP